MIEFNVVESHISENPEEGLTGFMEIVRTRLFKLKIEN